MVDKNLIFQIGADGSGAEKAFGQVARAAKKSMQETEDAIDDGRTAGQRLADALSATADDISTDLRKAKAAADALGNALGPELRARLGQSGVDDKVRELRRLGLTFEEIETDAESLGQAIKKLDTVRVEMEVGVDDQATAPLEEVDQRARDLDGTTTEVGVEADDRATDDIKSVQQRLAGLDGDDARVVINAEIADAQADIKRVLTGLRDVDGKEYTARVEVLDNAKRKLDSLQTELRDLDGKNVKFNVSGAGFDVIQDKLGEMSGSLGAAGAALGAAGPIGLGVGALVGGLLSSAGYAADLAIEIDEVARLTGISHEEASRLVAVWKGSGADVNDLKDVLVQMNGVLLDSPEIAAQLGINLNDGASLAERMVEVIERVRDSTLSASEQTQILSKLFGEEGVRQVSALEAQVGDLGATIEAVEAPQIFDEEDVAKARELKKQVNELKLQLQAMAVGVGEAVIPVLGWIGDQFKAAGDGIQYLEDKLDAATGQTDIEVVIDYSSFEAAADAAAETDAAMAAAAAKTEAVATAVDAFVKSSKPVEDMPATWEAVTNGVKRLNDGLPLTERQTQAIKVVMQQYGMTAEEVLGRATEMLGEVGEATETAAQEAEDAVAGFAALATAVSSEDWGRADFEAGQTAMHAYTEELNALTDLAAHQEEVFAKFGEAIKENGYNFEIATEAGRDNQDALMDLASTIDTELGAAWDAADGDMGKFRATANDIATRTLNRMQRELGLSTVEVEGLRVKLGLTAGDWEARIKMAGTEEARLKVGLLQSAIEGLPKDVEARVTQLIIKGDYQGALAEIDRYYSRNPAGVRVNAQLGDYSSARSDLQRYYDRNPVSIRADALIGRRAGGGRVPANENVTLVGEEGPELVSLPAGSMVHTASETAAMVSRVSSGDGLASATPVQAAPAGPTSQQVVLNMPLNVSMTVAGSAAGADMGQALVNQLVKAIRTSGPGPILSALGLAWT